MKRKALLAVLSLTLAPLSAQALVQVGVRGSYWLPRFSGELRVGDAGEGTRLDVKDDLGMDDEKFPAGEVFLTLGDHHLSLAGMRVDYSGDNTVNRDIEFGGTTFPVQGRVKSSLKYTMLDLAYQWDAIDLENPAAGFSLGPVLQVKYLDGEAKLSEATVGVETESFRLPIPMVGLGARVGILGNVLEARVRGVGMGYQGDRIVELQGELSFNPFPFLELAGGYRYFSIEVDREEVLLKYTQSGPYVGLTLKVGI